MRTYKVQKWNPINFWLQDDFWRLAHQMTNKINTAKINKEPLKNLRIYSKMASLSGGLDAAYKDPKIHLVNSEAGIASFGDLGLLFRRETKTVEQSAGHQSLDWNKPLKATKRNIRLEDIFHCNSSNRLSNNAPATHTGHILHGRFGKISYSSLSLL